MAFFDNLKEKAAELADKAKELADTGVSKAKELSEISKLKMQNANERDAIRKAYLEIGKLYYAEHGTAPEGSYVELCRQVTDSKAKIDYNNERIADMKAAGGLSDEEVPADEEEEIPAPVEEAPVEEVSEEDTPAE